MTPRPANTPLLIGIHGKAGSGKTTVADYLRKNINSAIPYSIIEPLRHLCAHPHLFGPQALGDMDLTSQEAKATMLPIGITYRELLQKMGAFLRSIDPDIFVNSTAKRCLNWPFDEDDTFIIPDVRFPNEARFIQDNGGILIKLARDPSPDTEEKHISETALDTWDKWDLYIDNRQMSIEEQNAEALDFVNYYLWEISHGAK